MMMVIFFLLMIMFFCCFCMYIFLFDFFLFILTNYFLLETIPAIPGDMMMTSSRDKGKLVFCNFFYVIFNINYNSFPYSEQYSSHIPIKNKRERNISKVFLDIFF